MPSVLVTGASSQIGQFLLPRLIDAGYQVHAISRQARSTPSVICHQLTPKQSLTTIIAATKPQIWLHIAPIWLLTDWLPGLPLTSLQRIIAISSTSVMSKQDSNNDYERALVQNLWQAEQCLMKQTLPWTIFRPTLVYGCGRDHNITTIANLIRRFKCFPIAGKGNGLRQPIHADDLAIACIDALNYPQTINKIYNLTGATTLTYRQMVLQIFEALQQRPCIVSLPLIALKIVVKLITMLPNYHHINFNMVNRMNEDLCFDYQQAHHDFNFSPRTFCLDQQSL